MSQYQDLDASLISAISSGHSEFHRIMRDPSVKDCVKTLVDQMGGDDFRYVDRRLQAVRKTGRIAYSRADGWGLTSSTAEKGGAE